MRVLLSAGLVVTILAVVLLRLPVLPPQADCRRLRWVIRQLRMLLVLSLNSDLLAGPVREFAGWMWGSIMSARPNCLAWAINRRDDHYDPGNHARNFRSDGRAARAATSQAERMALLELDGLHPLSMQDLRLVPDGYVVAVYVSTSRNPKRANLYHLIRRDSDGRWSDKPGTSAPRLLCRWRLWMPFVHVQRNDFAVLRFAGLWLVDTAKLNSPTPFVISRAAARVLGTTRIPQPHPLFPYPPQQ